MPLPKDRVQAALEAIDWPEQGLTTAEIVQRLARRDWGFDLNELEHALSDGEIFYGPSHALGAVPGDRWQV